MPIGHVSFYVVREHRSSVGHGVRHPSFRCLILLGDAVK